ncbi:GPO family capsid scaffolding protein [Serratia fonticola]|uniref:GPO family capsid scaffolding protein n=1 Tax=Serratia fonticola TaxID=47917 RepID=A0AAJ1YEM6_SERFO|nr:GPO family capsid scaffolding protein [Serratia fonticola]MDQ9126920.1 GPO family capsid scaffolding protein [Serratia fonticola]
MPASHLTTNFIRVATEGETVDKREIKAEWLVDMAETYDPNVYTALLWPEHERWFGSCGEVQELKAEVEDGLMRLYARICPSMDLLYSNRNGQLLFSSIEPTEDLNFRGTGKPYLEGLGVTNSPASIGTERMRFSANKTGKLYGALEPFVISDIADSEDLNMSDKDSSKKGNSIFRSLFNIPDKAQQENKQPAEKPKSKFFSKARKFSDEDIQVLAEVVAELQDTVDEQAATIDELQQNATDVEEVKTAIEEVQAEVDTIKEEVSGGEFKRLKSQLKDAEQKFGKLDRVTTKLPNPAPGDKGSKKYSF